MSAWLGPVQTLHFGGMSLMRANARTQGANCRLLRRNSDVCAIGQGELKSAVVVGMFVS
jgi:hypothetical protein